MSAERTPMDDLTDAIRLIVDELRDSSTTPALELAAALDPPKSVRVMPSDLVRFETAPVVAGPSRLLAGQQPDRVRLVIDAGNSTIYLTAVEGAEGGRSDTIAVTGRLELSTRAAVYASAGNGAASTVLVALTHELAEFSL